MRKERKTPLLQAWIFIIVTLTITYIYEFLIGHRTITFCLHFLVILYSCFLIAVILPQISKKITFQMVSAITYNIFYIYVLWTSITPLTFVYAFPLLFGIIASGDIKATKIMSILSTIIVGTFIALHLSNIEQGSIIITEYEIMFACMILSTISLFNSSEAINNIDNEQKIDGLTNIYNRKKINELKELNFFNENVTLILGDIDNFKKINDTYGHIIGDEILINVAKILKEVSDLYEDAYAIRIGGDEFCIICKQPHDKYIYDLIIEKLNKNDLLKQYNTSISFGISKIKNKKDINNLSDIYNILYDQADKDMYLNKYNGEHSSPSPNEGKK